ncbi:hypothetical protein BD626DRAFT_573914 [Schizophyllum amplum]|uniref:Uncharacterized protein n=1 Tax=Schizophyllum amplum TaxID=97359 RepID=A0A550BZZ8_9AGAR|nr:hypothetical protein BD626DRAFT_573914 [Auriculariopsis ampla]
MALVTEGTLKDCKKRGKRASLPTDFGRAHTFDLGNLGVSLGLLPEETSFVAPRSPPEQLPPELLIEIFLFCRTPGTDATDTRQCPWTLSQYVHVDALAYLALLPYYPSLLRTYLSRSAPLPIFVTMLEPNGRIHPSSRTEELRPDHERTLLDILADHADRWLSADLGLSVGSGLLERLRGCLPRLVRARLILYAPGAHITFLEGAPALATLVTPYLACASLSLPWDNLAHYDGPLRYTPVPRDPGLDALALLSNVVTFALRSPYQPLSSRPAVEFPRLRALSVFDPGCLARIKAPALEVLAVGGTMAAEAAAELLKRSRPAQMRALRLRCDSVSEISLAHIVAVAPGLEELRIYLKDGARHATHSELCAALASEAPPGLRFLALSASRQWFSEVGLQACPQLMTFAPPIRPNATATNQTFPSLISAIQMRAPGLAVIQLLADNLTAQTSARSSGEVVFIPKTKSAATSRAASPAAATSRSYLPFDIFADVAREQNDCEGARGSIAVSLVSPIRVPETVDSWANIAGTIGERDGGASLTSDVGSTVHMDDERLLQDAHDTSVLFPYPQPIHHSALAPAARRGLVRRYSLVPRNRGR